MLDINMFYQIEEAEKAQVNLKMIYVDMTGDLIAGLLLSQIVYWNLPSKNGKSKLKVSYNGRKGIAKSRADWWDEIRISVKQYARAINILIALKLVETQNTMFDGKRTPIIFLNEEKFIHLYTEELNKIKISPKRPYRSRLKVLPAKDEKYQSLTETTSEITTENKSDISEIKNTENKKEKTKKDKEDKSDISDKSLLTQNKKDCYANIDELLIDAKENNINIENEKIKFALEIFYQKNKLRFGNKYPMRKIIKDTWIKIEDTINSLCDIDNSDIKKYTEDYVNNKKLKSITLQHLYNISYFEGIKREYKLEEDYNEFMYDDIDGI